MLTLNVLDESLCICRLTSSAALVAPLREGAGVWIAIVAPDETTLVCAADRAPKAADVEAGWRAFKIEQTSALSAPGILASVLSPLAVAGIGIFATSTFSTDYILVKESDLPAAAKVLIGAGHQIAGPFQRRAP